jgi:site-specific recombinase XerD
MATRLLEVGTPFETIAAVLGHRSLESTRIYTKVDLEALRSAALEVEETSHV